MTFDQSSAANGPRWRKLTRKPVLLAAAALIATSALGLTLGNSVPFAAAETPQTIDTPYGRAPLSFADLVQKVSPAVVKGSGFFISADGFVVTNNHVVEDAEDITVTLENGDKYPATLVGSDPRTDVALVKVKAPKTFPFVEFSDKDPRVGDWVL